MTVAEVAVAEQSALGYSCVVTSYTVLRIVVALPASQLNTLRAIQASKRPTKTIEARTKRNLLRAVHNNTVTRRRSSRGIGGLHRIVNHCTLHCTTGWYTAHAHFIRPVHTIIRHRHHHRITTTQHAGRNTCYCVAYSHSRCSCARHVAQQQSRTRQGPSVIEQQPTTRQQRRRQVTTAAI